MSEQVICLSDSDESVHTVDNDDVKNDTDFNFPSVDFLYDNRNVTKDRKDEVSEKPVVCMNNVEFEEIFDRAGSNRFNELFDKYCIDGNEKKTKTVTLDDYEKSPKSRRFHKTRREEESTEKLLRIPEKEHRKNMQPGECLKTIKVIIDQGLTKNSFHSAIIDDLNDFGVSCKLESLPIDNSIIWTIKKEYINEYNETSTLTVNEIVIVWNIEEAASRVVDESFVSCIESISSLMPDKKLMLVIYGTEDYFRHNKNSTKQRRKNSNDSTIISKQDLEFCLAEIQLSIGCNCKFVDSRQELSMLVHQMTKSIAEKPFKLEKRQRLEENVDWYASGDNRDTVKVDKNGNGLKRLWCQQLCQFNLSSLETAEAISNIYPSPFLLMRAYANCNTSDGERLLSDIPIRRAAGPLSTVRKIGPELSKKIFIAFTSSDGETLLINDREQRIVTSQKNR